MTSTTAIICICGWWLFTSSTASFRCAQEKRGFEAFLLTQSRTLTPPSPIVGRRSPITGRRSPSIRGLT
ncbi:hypothetical protein P8452_01119 [Trifolium repens]|nr:hypothetical protein P8452_01119 [Trifolium repens]